MSGPLLCLLSLFIEFLMCSVVRPELTFRPVLVTTLWRLPSLLSPLESFPLPQSTWDLLRILYFVVRSLPVKG